MKSISAVTLIFLLLSGCATQQKMTLVNSFNPQEANLVFQTGKNTIKGSALLRQNNGNIVTCAGRQVSLVAGTTYSRERFLKLYGNNERGFRPAMFASQESPFSNDNPEYYKSMRNTLCDAQGFFKFEDVADGEYYVATVISWQVSRPLLEGGGLMQRVSIANGVTKEIVLSH